MVCNFLEHLRIESIILIALRVIRESASVEHEAAINFPPQVRKLIEDKGFVQQQIFNCDETGLFWKRMPTRTFLTKEEKKAPGFKVVKDRL